MCEMMTSGGVFLIFLKFDFLGSQGGGLKGQKIAQNEKYKLHLSRAKSQEPYII